MSFRAAALSPWFLTIDSRPQGHTFALDRDHHYLVHVPEVTWSRSQPTQVASKGRAKFENLLPDRLIGDLQPPPDQEFLHIPVTQGEPEIKPDRVPDDLRRELVPAIGDGLHPLPYRASG